MTKNNIWLLYSTFPTRAEAISAASALLEKRLVACANLYDHATSLYRWEGSIRQEPEVILMAKTSGGQVAAAVEFLKGIHSYELPCITAWPVEQGFAPYLQWVGEETATD